MSDYDSRNFNVDLINYQGPLDILLELAKKQKVNLENISITILADQFHEYIIKEKNLNLEVASEYLLMATWLIYLKSKLLLPSDLDEEFKVFEVAEKLKLQLKKLELIRLLSDQLLKKNILGKDVHLSGMKGGLKPISNSHYSVSLYELLKSYSNHVMKKNFSSINIPKLPLCSTDQGIRIIKNNLKELSNWKDISELVPSKFKKSNSLKRTGLAGIFSAALELTREGLITLMQKESLDKLLVKEKNE